jgi:cytochrome c
MGRVGSPSTLTTFMQTLGIPNDTERADLIAYLRMLSDAPIPLL